MPEASSKGRRNIFFKKDHLPWDLLNMYLFTHKESTGAILRDNLSWQSKECQWKQNFCTYVIPPSSSDCFGTSFGFVFAFAPGAQQGGHFLCAGQAYRKCTKEPKPRKPELTRKDVNNYKIFNVQWFDLCYNCNCNDEYYEYNLCQGTMINDNWGLYSAAQGDYAYRLCSFASIAKKTCPEFSVFYNPLFCYLVHYVFTLSDASHFSCPIALSFHLLLSLSQRPDHHVHCLRQHALLHKNEDKLHLEAMVQNNISCLIILSQQYTSQKHPLLVSKTKLFLAHLISQRIH